MANRFSKSVPLLAKFLHFSLTHPACILDLNSVKKDQEKYFIWYCNTNSRFCLPSLKNRLGSGFSWTKSWNQRNFKTFNWLLRRLGTRKDWLFTENENLGLVFPRIEKPIYSRYHFYLWFIIQLVAVRLSLLYFSCDCFSQVYCSLVSSRSFTIWLSLIHIWRCRRRG